MPKTVPPARYDLPWKAVITHAFRPFMDFYFPDLSARIDWRQRPRFLDKELAGFGLGSAPELMVADQVVEVCMRNGRNRRLLVHIEIQAQRDIGLARRINDYNYRIGKARRQRVTSLVLLADADPNWRPCGFRQREEGNERTFAFKTAKLLDFTVDTDALAASHNPVSWFTLAHVLTQQTHHHPAKRYASKLYLTRLLFKHRWSPRRIIVLFNALNWMMTLPEPYERRFGQAINRLEKEHEMKLLNPLEQLIVNDHIKKCQAKGLKQGLRQGLRQGRQEGMQKGRQEGMQKGLQEGRQEGRQEGLAQGRLEGAAALLEHQLVQRFGPLPPTARNRLANASVEQLEAWSDALAEAQSLRQVFGASR